jgi:hypothetical protein
VVGEPGIGKSRRLGDDVAWLERHCLSFGHAIAFHPLIDLLKRSFQIEEGDPEGTITGKIEQGILEFGDDLRPVVPYLRYLRSRRPRRLGHATPAAAGRGLRRFPAPRGPGCRSAASGPPRGKPPLGGQGDRAVPDDAGRQRPDHSGPGRLHLSPGLYPALRRAELLHAHRSHHPVGRGHGPDGRSDASWRTCSSTRSPQDVAYGSLLVQRRKELHRLIGLAILRSSSGGGPPREGVLWTSSLSSGPNCCTTLCLSKDLTGDVRSVCEDRSQPGAV